MKVLVTGNVREEGLKILREFAEVVTLPEPAPKEDIIRHIADSDAVLHKIGFIQDEELGHQKKLKLVARHGVGLDLLDIPSFKKHNIPVSITPTANSRSVAEATIALMLAALRKLSQGESMLKNEKKWAREKLMGKELGNLTVGLIGYGRIGRIVASILDGFSSKVIVYDVNPAMALEDGRKVVPLDELLSQSDVISLHCPLMDSTRGIINAEAISKMKDGVVLVNTARGPLFDGSALAQGLESGKIGAVATDSFDAEPPDFSDPIFKFPNALTTPHIAAMTEDAQVAMAVGAAEEIRRVLVEGKEPSNNVWAK